MGGCDAEAFRLGRMSAPSVAAAPHIPVRPAWLELRHEAPLPLDVPIIDAHHHLWDRPGSCYLAPELQADILDAGGVAATIYVQCRSFYHAQGPEDLRPVGEVEYAARVAAEAEVAGGPRLCVAIIGGADLCLGDGVARVLEAMWQAGDGRFRGVRNPLAWHANPAIRSSPVLPPPGLMADRRFREGVGWLARLGLTLDIWAYQTQLSEVLALASAFSDVSIVLDHIGGRLGDEQDESWRADLRALSRLQNVSLKLGGMGMPVAGYRFHDAPLPPSSAQLAAAWRRTIMACIEMFGPERCMFESNFPVDKGMFSYVTVWNAFKRLTADFTPTERFALFSGTAGRVYGLAG